MWQESKASQMSESLKLGHAWDFRHYYSGGMSQSLRRAHRPCPSKDSSKSIQGPIPAPPSFGQNFSFESLAFKVIAMSKGYFPKLGARKYTCTPFRDLSVVDMPFKCHIQELDSSGLIWHKFTQDFEKMCSNPVSPLNLVGTAQYFQLSNTRPTAGVSHILLARLC